MNAISEAGCRSKVQRMVPVLVRAMTHDRRSSLRARLFGATFLRYRETTDQQVIDMARWA